MAFGGGFPLHSPCAPSQYVTGQSKFVGNGSLVPEVKESNSCSLKCNCLEGLTRCETSSSRYYSWDEGLTFDSYCETFAAGEKPKVPDLIKSTCNCTLSMMKEFRAKPVAAVSSVYFDPISCRNRPPLHSSEGQRSSKGTGINPTMIESSHEFKADDASSYNTLSKSSGDLEIVSESINECLVQDARPRETDNMQTTMKGLKRKAAELLKKPARIEVQSERRSKEDSRIVRVSRLTGGKDRHSKVRTAKGLRDRRVRLSVSTAIQFYDLQDRLGYEQPSLAVDWLLKAAQPFIAELPQSDKDVNSLSVSVSAPVVDAVSNLASTNCSPVKRKESATATASAKSDSKFSEKELTIDPRKYSEAGKSNSSASDGSIMGAEYTSKSTSLSKSERLKKARERFKRKSASAKIPAAFSHANSLECPLQSQFINVLSYKDESSNDISNEISGDHFQDQLWDCGTQLSYADILCKDSRQLQHKGHLGTSSAAALPQSMQPGMRSCFEIADSGMTHIDSNQRNSLQLYFNPMYTYLPQQQQQSYEIQKHFGSPFVNAYGNDISFTTSGSCTSRGPLQSNTASCLANYSPLHTQKNVNLEAYTRPNMLPFYDPRISERFSSSLNDNANNEATQ